MSYALLSVSNKEGIVDLASSLYYDYKYDLISSGGTAKVIADADIPVSKVSEYTNSPEILGGRVKTLHPRVHGGILVKRNDEAKEILATKKNLRLLELDVNGIKVHPYNV